MRRATRADNMTPTEKTNPAAYQAACQQILAIIDAAKPPRDPTELSAADVPAAADNVVPFAAAPSRVGSRKKSARRKVGGALEPLPDELPPLPEAVDGDGCNLDLRLADLPCTDLGNARRFAARNKKSLLWSSVLGWLWWDGKRWCRDGADDRVRMAEHDCVHAIAKEGSAIKGTKRDIIVGYERDATPIRKSDRLMKWAVASQAAAKMAPIARHAAPYLAIDPARLDADPFVINTLSGTLTVAKTADGSDYIRIRPHDPADLITKIAPVEFDPAAACPQFDKFFVEIQKDADTRAFLLRWLGYNLVGDTSEQKLAVFWGKGRNGKSVLVDTCAHIAGDYAETIPIETFLAEGRGRSAGQATPDLAILPGKRSLRTSEPSKGASLDEALIKLATGGEPLQARHLNRDYFKFYPVFKLTISGNYRPKIGGTDEGIWGRVVLVPFLEFIPPEKRDPQLTAKLRAEASGILNRLLDGLREWLDKGLVPPKEVTDATAEYRRDSDQLGRFLEGVVVRKEGARVQSSVLLATFNAWAKATGGTEWKGRGLANAMTERGYKKDKSSVMFWLDIELIKMVSDFVDERGEPLRDTDSPPPVRAGPAGDDEIVF
jgi:putative DNA primase/helicase